jgi:hypothetical protein
MNIGVDRFRVSERERDSNENTNGLLCQYFPIGTSLSAFDQADLDTVGDSLNVRPRRTLDFATPSEQFNRLPAVQNRANKAPAGALSLELGSALLRSGRVNRNAANWIGLHRSTFGTRGGFG